MIREALRASLPFSRNTFQVHAPSFGLSGLLFPSALSTSHRGRVHVALCDFVPPLLVFPGPHFLGAALATRDDSVHVEPRKAAVGVVVNQLGRVRHYRAGRWQSVFT